MLNLVNLDDLFLEIYLFFLNNSLPDWLLSLTHFCWRFLWWRCWYFAYICTLWYIITLNVGCESRLVNKALMFGYRPEILFA